MQTVTISIAVLTFLFGVIQYFRSERTKQDDRRIEAARPFLELQLKLYQDVTGAASTIVTSQVAAERDAASLRFKRLYWGQLSMVEDTSVEAAMVNFASALDEGADLESLQIASLELAHACRASLSRSWNTSAWQYTQR